MTTPERTYWESSTASNDRPAASALRRHPVTRLELGRVDDLHVGEGHLGPGVLGYQHRRRPLLPVRAFAAREADGAVPALELVGQERLDQIVALVALGGVERVGQERHLGIAVECAVDRVLLELGQVLLR